MNPSLRKLAAAAAIWALLGMFLSVGVYLNLRSELNWAGFEDIAVPQFVRVAMWAAMAPFVLRLRERIPLSRGRWLLGTGFHVAFSFLVMAVYYLGRLAGYRLLMGEPIGGFWDGIAQNFYGHNLVDMAFYWAVLAYGYGAEIQQKYKNEELRAARLEARLVETELKTLREQLRPHFLFNTLNTASMLVREGKRDEAVTLLARLGSLLRMSLDRPGGPEPTLREEILFLNRYVEIQRSRFPDRLSVEIEIEPAALEFRIPHLLLQPIVENAILHGIAPKSGPGRVDVRGQIQAGRLRLEVSDDGPGIAGDGPVREGIGLANTRERIARMYGDAGRMILRSEPGRGLSVEILIPCRT